MPSMPVPTSPVPAPGNPAQALPSPPGDVAAPQHSVLQRSVFQRLRSALRRALHAAAGALQRAERRITEGFRVPPHGG